MFGRRHINTRRELVRAEFGESMDLFRQAAVHAAGGFGATVGPRYGAAREKINTARGYVGPATNRISNAASTSWDTTIATLAPLAEAARQGSAKARKLDTKSWRHVKPVKVEVETSGRHVPRIAVLLATGAAVGAAGALVVRRRNRAKWAEYEPVDVNPEAISYGDTSAYDASEPSPVTKVASWAKEQSKSTYESLRHKIHEATADPVDKIGDTGSQMANGGTYGGTKADQVNPGVSRTADKSTAKSGETSRTSDAAHRTGEAASRTASREGDAADDLLRSAKNGRI